MFDTRGSSHVINTKLYLLFKDLENRNVLKYNWHNHSAHYLFVLFVWSKVGLILNVHISFFLSVCLFMYFCKYTIWHMLLLLVNIIVYLSRGLLWLVHFASHHMLPWYSNLFDSNTWSTATPKNMCPYAFQVYFAVLLYFIFSPGVLLKLCMVQPFYWIKYIPVNIYKAIPWTDRHRKAAFSHCDLHTHCPNTLSRIAVTNRCGTCLHVDKPPAIQCLSI